MQLRGSGVTRSGEMATTVYANSCMRCWPTLLVFLFVLLVPCASAAAQSWKWTTETVDSAGKFMSLVFDSVGNLHMSYALDDSGIRYAYRPRGSQQWFKMMLVSGASKVSYTGITVDRQDFPYICFTPGTMQLAHYDGSRWDTQQIAPGAGRIFYACSVAVSADGTPHVTWYQERTAEDLNYLHFKYAVLKNGAWLAKTVDFDPQTGKWNMMLLDSEGNPHVSYDCYVFGQLKYAVFDGKKWGIRTIDSRRGSNEPLRGMGNSLHLNPDGTALISYYDENSLKFARQTGDKWSIETVDSIKWLGSWVGYRSSLAVDHAGGPHIVYEDASTLKHAYLTPDGWTSQVLAPPGADQYRYSAIAVGPDDKLYVAFRDAFDGSVKMAVGTRVQSQDQPEKAAPAASQH